MNLHTRCMNLMIYLLTEPVCADLLHYSISYFYYFLLYDENFWSFWGFVTSFHTSPTALCV